MTPLSNKKQPSTSLHNLIQSYYSYYNLYGRKPWDNENEKPCKYIDTTEVVRWFLFIYPPPLSLSLSLSRSLSLPKTIYMEVLFLCLSAVLSFYAVSYKFKEMVNPAEIQIYDDILFITSYKSHQVRYVR